MEKNITKPRPKSLRRRIYRILFMGLGASIGLFLGLGMALESGGVADNLRRRIEVLVKDYSGVELRIESLELSLLRRRIRARGVEYSDQRGGIVFSANDLDARFQLLPSSSGKLVVQSLRMRDVDLQLRVSDDKKEALQKKENTQAKINGLPVELEHIEVADARLSWFDGAAMVSASVPWFQVLPSGSGENAHLEVAAIEVGDGKRRLRGRARFSARYSGSFSEPGSVVFVHCEAQLGALNLESCPRVEHDEGWRMTQGLVLAAELSELQSDFDDKRVLVEGAARLELMLSGRWPEVEPQIEFKVGGLTIAGELLGDIAVETALRSRRAVIESFNLRHPRAGSLVGSGEIEFNSGWPIRLSLGVRDARLEEILRLAGVGGAFVAAKVGGRFDLNGTLSPFDIRGQTDLLVSTFSVFDSPYYDTKRWEIMELKDGAIAGPFTMTAESIYLDGVSVKHQDSKLNVVGSLFFDTQRGMEFSAVGDEVHLGQIGDIADIPFAGTGRIAATIEGPYSNELTISAAVEMEQFGLLGVPVGRTLGTVIYHDLLLDIPRVKVRRAGGSAEGFVSIHFEEKGTKLLGDARLSDVRLRDILRSAGLDTMWQNRVRGRVSGAIKLAGPIAGPTGTVVLTGDKLSFDAVEWSKSRFTGELFRRDFLARGTLAGLVDQKRAEISAGIDEDLRWRLRVAAPDLELGSWSDVLGLDELKGRGRLNLSLTGIGERVDGGNGEFEGRLFYDNLAFGRTVAKLSQVPSGLGMGGPDNFKLKGSAFDGHLPFTATFDNQGDAFFESEIELKDLSLAALDVLSGEDDVRVSGKIEVGGGLRNAKSIRATASVHALEAKVSGGIWKNRGKFELEYRDERVYIAPTVLRNAGHETQLSGWVGSDGRCELTVVGDGEIQNLGPIFGGYRAEGGRLTLDLGLSGLLSDPELDGSLDFKDVLVPLPEFSTQIEKGSGRIEFHRHEGRFRDIQAKLGGGQVDVSGNVLLSKGDWSLELQSRLERVGLKIGENIDANVSGVVVSSGPSRDLLIDGDLSLHQLIYTANLDLRDLLADAGTPNLVGEAVDLNRDVRLALRLHARDNVLLVNSSLEAEFSAELTISGSPQRIGLLGQLTTLWGEGEYQSHNYTLKGGSVWFNEEFRIAPNFDIAAETEACGMEVDVRLLGDAKSYAVEAHGRDENGAVETQDVLSCLQFGIRSQDLNAVRDAGAGGPSAFSASSLSSLDALWTVTGMDQTVRKFLPVVDELRLTSAWSNSSRRVTPRVVVGKNIGDGLQLKYSRTLEDLDQSVSIEYRVNQFAILEGTWNSESTLDTGLPLQDFGLDLRLHWDLE